MPERFDHQPYISVEKALQLEIIIHQALLDILITKGIISEEELVTSMQKIRREQEQIIRPSGNIVTLKDKHEVFDR